MHKAQRRELRCSECNDVFTSTLLLKEHFAVHSGETFIKPHKCDYCDKRFMYKYACSVSRYMCMYKYACSVSRYVQVRLLGESLCTSTPAL